MAAFLSFVLPLVVAGLSFVAGFAAGVWKAAKMQARREMEADASKDGMIQPTHPWPRK